MTRGVVCTDRWTVLRYGTGNLSKCGRIHPRQLFYAAELNGDGPRMQVVKPQQLNMRDTNCSTCVTPHMRAYACLTIASLCNQHMRDSMCESACVSQHV